MEFELSSWIGGAIGLVLVWLSRFLVAWFVDRVKKGIPVPAPSATIETKWADLINDPKQDKSGRILGDLERTFYYLAFWLGAEEIIAGWFALKVASKWEAWGTTGRLPESLEGVDPVDYAISRRRWASQRLMSFLVGTIFNVLAAFAGVLMAKHLLLPFLARCF